MLFGAESNPKTSEILYIHVYVWSTFVGNEWTLKTLCDDRWTSYFKECINFSFEGLLA